MCSSSHSGRMAGQIPGLSPACPGSRVPREEVGRGSKTAGRGRAGALTGLGADPASPPLLTGMLGKSLGQSGPRFPP